MYIRDIVINYKTNGFVLFYTLYVQFPLITHLIIITYIFKPLTYFIIWQFGIEKYQNMIKSPVFSRSYNKINIT